MTQQRPSPEAATWRSSRVATSLGSESSAITFAAINSKIGAGCRLNRPAAPVFRAAAPARFASVAARSGANRATAGAEQSHGVVWMSDWLKRRFWWVPFGEVPELPPAALQAALSGSEPPFLLDVRTKGEWQQGRIEGAVNVPVSELKARLSALGLDPQRPIVAICRSAHRSIGAVRLLELNGFSAARQLQGGMLAWQRAGLPAVGGPTP